MYDNGTFFTLHICYLCSVLDERRLDKTGETVHNLVMRNHNRGLDKGGFQIDNSNIR